MMMNEDMNPVSTNPSKDVAEPVENRDEENGSAQVTEMMEEDVTGMIAEEELDKEPVVQGIVAPEEPVDESGNPPKPEDIDSPQEDTQTDEDEDEDAGTVDPESRIAELEQIISDHQNHKLRMLADLDNFRKRSQRDLQNAVNKAQADLLSEFLPVFDSLELALDHARDSSSVDGMREGVEMVLRLFRSALAKFGIQEIDATGQAFDPAFHEAMAQADSDEVPVGMVLKQWQKGFLLGEKLIRPCRVVVSRGPAAEPQPPAGEEPSGDQEE